MIQTGFLVVAAFHLLGGVPVADGDTSEITLTSTEKARVYAFDMIQREIQTPDLSGKTYELVSLIHGTSEQALAVLRDYERYPEFMPNVAKTEVVSRDADACVVNYTLKLPLGKTKKYRLKLWTECQGHRSVVHWSKLPWPDLPENETIVDTRGSWTIEPSEKDGYLLVRYRAYTDPGKVPTGLGWIVDFLTSKSLPGVVTALRNRIEALYHAAPANAATPEG